jgi:AcrR family transcriptional regulator
VGEGGVVDEVADRSGRRSRRDYRSPLRARRAEETRQALLVAAHRLFVSNGWTATGMRDVAAEAGVALETLYAYFASKRGLFQAVVDVAVVGDDRPVALAERGDFAAMGRGRRADRIAAAARVVVSVNGRTAGLAKVLREAAASDDALADELRATRERQRRDVSAAFQLIVGREPTVAERDGLWALTSPDVYLLLVEESGWTPDQLEAWLAQALERLVPRAPRSRRVPR